MKKITLVFAAISFFYFHSAGQDTMRYSAVDTTIVTKYFPVKAEGIDNQLVSGWLGAITDSAIMISGKKIPFNPRDMVSPEWNKIHSKDLVKVTFRRKGSVGRGIIYGMLIGAAAGALLGAASYTHPQSTSSDPLAASMDYGVGFNIIGGAATGMVGGAAVGAIVGALAKKTFIIKGNSEKYERMKRKMNKKVYGF